MSMPTAEELIEFLGLEPLEIEGGWYRQTYISAETISADHLPERYSVDKPFSTQIYFLLRSKHDSFSAMHRLPTDEVYHFYLGDPVEMLLLASGGTSEVIILGGDLFGGQYVQHTVPAGVWQGSRLVSGGEWALMGTTMAPGFTLEDFEAGSREGLVAAYPDRKEWIAQLTWPE
jgi:predicted cupin superfamily sugar epimerase